MLCPPILGLEEADIYRVESEFGILVGGQAGQEHSGGCCGKVIQAVDEPRVGEDVGVAERG